MFKIFSGNWRGIGNANAQSALFVQVGVEFRSILHHFRGAPLAVFMAIALHADTQGEARPSYDLLCAETGLSRDTVANAIEYLCGLTIEGQRVLLRYRVRDARTHRFIGSNRYIIFPAPQQIAQYASGEISLEQEPESDFSDSGNSDCPAEPESDFSEVGKSDSKKNHSLSRTSSSSSAPAAKKPPVLELYRRLRPGHIAIPDTHWRESAEKVLANYLAQHGLQGAVDALQPYAREAEARGLSPTNLCWLTEWAATGKIPAKRQRRAAPKSAKGEAKPKDMSGEELEALRKRARELLAPHM